VWAGILFCSWATPTPMTNVPHGLGYTNTHTQPGPRPYYTCRTCSHTQSTHTSTQTDIHKTNMPNHIRAYITHTCHTYTHTHIHTYTHTHIHTSTKHTYTHTDIHAYTYTYTDINKAHIQTYTHTDINKAHILDTHIRIYTHTHIHTYRYQQSTHTRYTNRHPQTRIPDTLHKTNMTIVLDTATENAPEDASAAA